MPSKLPQLNVRVSDESWDRLDRLRVSLEELHGHGYSQADAIQYALVVAERMVGQELMMARTARTMTESPPAPSVKAGRRTSPGR